MKNSDSIPPIYFSKQRSAHAARYHRYAAACLAALAVCGAIGVAHAQTKAATAPHTWATFSTGNTSLQGGNVNGFSYSEKPGDVVAAPPSISGGSLFVRGNFVAKSASAWSGLGVSVEAGNNQPMDASAYRTLSIRLSSINATKLRLRLGGTDEKIRSSGCYPSFSQYVTSEERSYEIPLSRFVPDSYCGANAVDVAKTLQRLMAIEVTDTNDPIKARSAQFTVASIVLLP